MTAEDELEFLARIGRILQEWTPRGSTTRDEAYELVRSKAREIRGSLGVLPEMDLAWDSTGDPTLDRILEVLEERVDPELTYVPAAGPSRRRTWWRPV